MKAKQPILLQANHLAAYLAVLTNKLGGFFFRFWGGFEPVLGISLPQRSGPG